MQSEEEDPCAVHSFCIHLERGGHCKQDVVGEVAIPLPSSVDADEVFSHVLATNNVHEMYKEELRERLEELVAEAEEKWEEDTVEAAMEEALQEGRLIDINYWDTLIDKKSDTKTREKTQLAERFSFIMENSSPEKLNLLVELEEKMAEKVHSLIMARDCELEKLRWQAEDVVQSTLKRADTDSEHMQLSALNCKMRQVLWTYVSQLEQLGEQQRIEFRAVVDALFEGKDFCQEAEAESHFKRGRPRRERSPRKENESFLDESFTIYLGAQLKTMQNVRLLSSPSLCWLVQPFNESWQRLQSSIGLYGRRLNGLVLLVGKDPLYHIENKTELAHLCEQSTELHFPSLAAQLKEIEGTAREASAARRRDDHHESPAREASAARRRDDHHGSPAREASAARRRDDHHGSPNQRRFEEGTLSLGDVYITRHSNLGNVQVVFHVVVDGKLDSEDINSRHYSLNGIRNIIRMCSRFGVCSINMPLLLIERANEGTTIPWCMKRAELIFKCVKGYLMEVCGSGWSSASLGGVSVSNAPHYNVNFILPSSLSPSVYSQILSLFPTIFHLVPSVKA